MTDRFETALVASGPDPAIADELDLFGRFVGEWRIRNRWRAGPDAAWNHSESVWLFQWIVGGLGIQDVIVGRDAAGAPASAGTTVRAYDPTIGAWRVTWFGLRHGNHCTLLARPHGADGIRQDGVESASGGDIPIRWNFSDITADSFAWDGWSSADGGATWWLEQHMDVERVA
jgi:hypothetical protein